MGGWETEEGGGGNVGKNPGIFMNRSRLFFLFFLFEKQAKRDLEGRKKV